MKSVLVTGASSGIGAEVARAAAAAGWGVWIGYGQGKDRAELLLTDILGKGGRGHLIQLDLGDIPRLDEQLKILGQQAGALDAMVLAASPAPLLSSFTQTPPDAFRSQFDVNVVGHQRLMAYAWKQFFRKQGAGHVVGLLSTMADRPPQPQMASYVVAKRALEALLECGLAEWGSGGFRASTVTLGYTDTPMLRACNDHIVEMARTKSGGRFLEAGHVAQAILKCLENAPAAGELKAYRLENETKGLMVL